MGHQDLQVHQDLQAPQVLRVVVPVVSVNSVALILCMNYEDPVDLKDQWGHRECLVNEALQENVDLLEHKDKEECQDNLVHQVLLGILETEVNLECQAFLDHQAEALLKMK